MMLWDTLVFDIIVDGQNIERASMAIQLHTQMFFQWLRWQLKIKIMAINCNNLLFALIKLPSLPVV